jgi:hypothetical protein
MYYSPRAAGSYPSSMYYYPRRSGNFPRAAGSYPLNMYYYPGAAGNSPRAAGSSPRRAGSYPVSEYSDLGYRKTIEGDIRGQMNRVLGDARSCGTCGGGVEVELRPWLAESDTSHH